MPGEVIDRPNPKALPSLIPDNVMDLAVKLDYIKLNDSDLKGLEEFRRASNYIAAGKPVTFLIQCLDDLFWFLCMYKSISNRDSYDFPFRQCLHGTGSDF